MAAAAEIERSEQNQRIGNLLNDARADRQRADREWAENARRFDKQQAENAKWFEAQKAESDRWFNEQLFEIRAIGQQDRALLSIEPYYQP